MYTLGVPANALLAAKAVLVLVVILLYSDYTRRLLNQTFSSGKDPNMAQRIKPFLLHYGPLLTTITIFILAYFIGGQMYPAMQKPQVFFNLFINNGSLLIVSIGMTLVILTGGIDLSVGGVLALTTAASAALLKSGVSPLVVMPLMIAHGDRIWVYPGLYYPFLKVQPFIVTLMGLFFARGLAYIISLTSVTINEQFL